MEIIATHVSSDFDSFAGMVAAKKLYPDAEILLPSSINQNVRKFISLHEDALPAFKEQKNLDVQSIKRVIIIDTKIASRLGSLKEIIEDKKVEVIIFDHHQKSAEDIGYGIDYTKKVGATVTLLVDFIKKRKIKISPFEATLFSLGIYEDTGSFSFPNTSYKDFEAAAFLKKNGANMFVISKFLNLSLSSEQHKLLEKLISGLKKINVFEKEIIISSAQSASFVEGLSVLTRKLGQVEDVDVVICWVKMKDKIYIVARSDDPGVNVSKILEPVGGGGHTQASSAVLKNITFGKIENMIISSLYKNIKKPVMAKDIMSFPIRVVNEKDSIAAVNGLLQKYGHTGIPIIDSENNLVGIITRKDIDRAVKHGLSHAPVKGFKSRGLITTGPNTTVEEIQRLMIENGIGRIPVVQKSRVIGIVTRKDVLRYLHGRDYLKYPSSLKHEHDFDFSVLQARERLYSLMPEKIIKIFEIISDLSKQLKIKAYLVGGIVRDLLLGIPNLDIDIVVEGDGINFAKSLALLLNARVESYEKFKTAVIVLEDNQHIDIVSARIEYYRMPAALPDVEPGSLSQDLARRDFTINTIAISLNKASFGEIIDYFGARKDLAQKRIKVLHKLSFVEDPTRIFRAARFEQRLGFKMDRQTEKLALLSIDMNIVSKLNGIRIRDELIAILNEKNPVSSIKRLYSMGALKKIGINIVLNEKFIRLLKNIIEKYKKFSSLAGQDLQLWRLLLASLFTSENEDLIKKWCSEMKIRKKDSTVIIDSAMHFNSYKKKMSVKIKNNSEIYDLLKGTPEEFKIMLSAAGRIQFENISRYYNQIAGIILQINGEDLKKSRFKPSKAFRLVFERILKMKLNGIVKTKQQELDEALKMLSGFEK